MSDQQNPFDLLLAQFRVIVREEIAAAIGNGIKPAVEKVWLRAEELAKRYGFRRPGSRSAGEMQIARTKPGRYVLFKCRDVEAYFERHNNSIPEV